MLNPELKPTAQAAASLATEHEELLLLLTTLRAAGGDALYVLYFARSYCRSASYRRLTSLVTHGLLARQQLAEKRSVYRLAHAAHSLSERVRVRSTDNSRKPLTDEDADHCWLRSALWAELVTRGYRVGRGRDEVLALRRFLVDEQAKRAAGGGSAARVLTALRSEPALTPLFRSRCASCRWQGPLGSAIAACPTCRGRAEQALAERRFECPKCGHVSDCNELHDNRRHTGRRCKGAMREVDHLSFDVAWRTATGTREVLLVFVDEPGRDLIDQLRALPLRIAGQPRVPIVLRTTDPFSVFDRAKSRWVAKGERHRALLRAFSESGDKHSFPFSTTADVVDIRPELQLRLSPHRRTKDMTHA
ncbi:MAG: hypothetical protein HYS27_22935 [Deltaproteobacteria bacterium]|nr:hypothetical protein [Deltaproteobacteria bacterium]